MPKRNGTKEKIKKEAIGLFLERGLYDPTMAEIAKAAGITEGTLYYHFQNWEILILSILLSFVNNFAEELNPILSVFNECPPAEKLFLLFKKTRLTLDKFTRPAHAYHMLLAMYSCFSSLKKTSRDKELTPIIKAISGKITEITALFDDIIKEKSDKLNPCVIRQALIGSFMFLFYNEKPAGDIKEKTTVFKKFISAALKM